MGQYCFARCRLSSVVVVCNAAGGRSMGRRARGRSAAAGPGECAVERPTLHGGPVRLRPVKATLFYMK